MVSDGAFSAPSLARVLGSLMLLLMGWQVSACEANPAVALAERSMVRAGKIARMNKGEEPVDACSLENNWQYDVLYHLSLAVESSPTHTLRKLKEEHGSLGIEESLLFKKWRLALPVERTEEALLAIVTDSEWWPYRQSLPAYWLQFTADGGVHRHTFEESEPLGRWAWSDGAVLVRLNTGDSVTLQAEHRKYFFNQGSQWFYHLYLSTGTGDDSLPWYDPLILGPPQGDCGPYNF